MLVKLDADLSVMFGTQLFLRKQFLDPATNAGLENAVRARAGAQAGVRVSNTGGWQSWRTVPTNIQGVTGTHTVYLTFESGQPADFVNVNWFDFGH